MKLEIERKFLLKSLPDIKPYQVVEIEQFYFKNEKPVSTDFNKYKCNCK